MHKNLHYRNKFKVNFSNIVYIVHDKRFEKHRAHMNIEYKLEYNGLKLFFNYVNPVTYYFVDLDFIG